MSATNAARFPSLPPGQCEPSFRSVLEHSLDAVLLTAPDGRIAMANPAASALFGYTEAELCALGRAAIVEPADPRLAPALEERSRTGRFRGELTMKRKDGRPIEVELSSAVFRSEDGREWTSMFIREITERKAHEADRERLVEMVRANERLLDGIFELLPVGLWITGPGGTISRGNPAGKQIWAGALYVGPERFGEYRGWWLDSGKRIEPHEWAVARALTKGETSIGELIRIQCFDDSFKTIRNSALPLHDENGAFSGAVIVNEDITQLMQTEEALRRAVAAREHVLGVVAHDLRNPLHVIQMQAQLLLSIHEGSGDLGERLQSIRRQVKRMDRMIDDLLDMTRLEAGTLAVERAPIDLQALLEEVAQAHRPLAEAAGLALRIEAAAGTPGVEADRGRIVQVLDNLLGNAMKFTPPGGRVTVRVAPGKGEAVFSVSDTGVGMDLDAQGRVFDRLWQADPDQRGVGLGLAIAKAIVEAHGGRIRLQSAPGAGSTFYFSLPARQLDTAAQPDS